MDTLDTLYTIFRELTKKLVEVDREGANSYLVNAIESGEGNKVLVRFVESNL